MGDKKRLIYSVLMFLLAAILLIQVGFSWFQQIKYNNVEDITLSHKGFNISLSQSKDDNLDGIPDEDENGIIYSVAYTENVVFSNIFPMAEVAYKAYVSVPSSGGYFTILFKGLSEPDIETPEVDITQVMRIRYTDPLTSLIVDKTLYELMDQNRDATVISRAFIESNGELDFSFIVYMDSTAGNEYKNKVLGIEKIVLSVTQM